jgi:hypothetical protein
MVATTPQRSVTFIAAIIIIIIITVVIIIALCFCLILVPYVVGTLAAS